MPQRSRRIPRAASAYSRVSPVFSVTASTATAALTTDLGRRIDRNFTPGALASTMWNHAPTMWAAMRERDIGAGDLDEQAAADLFAYFYSVRFFEKPGDAGRGKRLFTERACAQCHGLSEPIKPGVKPVSQWAGLADPIALTEGMWNHLPSMWAAFEVKRVRWPQLTGQDLADLLVYMRNLPVRAEDGGVFETSAGSGTANHFSNQGMFRLSLRLLVLADQIRGGFDGNRRRHVESRAEHAGGARAFRRRRDAGTAELSLGPSILRRRG
jgi:mono/diheme cytochrome c family protein